MPSFSVRDPRLWAAILLIAAIANAVPPMTRMSIDPKAGDSPAYLLGAYHLVAHGVYSTAETTDAPSSEVGREPGYSFLLAGVMRLSPRFGTFTPACLAANGDCPIEIYRPAQWVNLGLVFISGLALAGAVLVAGLGTGPALLAGAYVVLNPAMNKNWAALASDPLAVALVSLSVFTLAWAFRSGGASRWFLVGLVAAFVALTKAVFLWGFPPIWAGAVALAFLRRRAGRAGAIAGLVAALGFLVPTGAWTLRNASVGGEYVFTDSRSAIALSTREVFNHMSARENLVAFVYWTRGFGEKAAANLFSEGEVKPFDFGTPGGYYDVGQHRVGLMEEELVGRGLSRSEAKRVSDRWVVDRFFERPLGWIASTPALFWRGVWGDEFILIGLPALFWVAVRALRRRRSGVEGVVASIGLFNLLFYATVSLNIPRYQATAVPSLAFATALAFAAFRDRRAGVAARRGM